ncbi:MAG: adenylate/guanylate cyclase domain-containing protein, partial [Gammaproteobacteria bacterium]|nr:adenylate/guanylate cyclase domain-containing protein [Gammaproteobacteria bacterium]
GGDGGRRATLQAALSHAYGWAGLLNEALDANDKALEDVAAIGSFDQQFLGYSVEHWALSLRGRILARLGRFAEAELCFDSMLSFERKSVDPTVQFIAHVGYLDMAWAYRQPALAQRHAARISDIAERHPNAYLRVFSLACQGIARTIEEDFAAAIDPFVQSLALLRESKAAMEFEPELVASLAECRLRTGRHAEAVAVAREAIALARSRGSRLPEFRALVIYGVATLAMHPGDAETMDAMQALDDAERLLALTGAVIYAPMLAQAREQARALKL